MKKSKIKKSLKKFLNNYRFELILFVVTFIIYRITSRGEGAAYDYHVRLAAAMLQGRLDYGQNIPWFELAEFRGKFFTVFPPFPAIMLVPFVFLFGPSFYQPWLSILVAALSGPLCYRVILKLTKEISVARAIAILYCFGTILWFHAEVGSGWYVAQIVGLFFSWLGLYLGLCRGQWFLAGLAYSAAYLSRVPAVMGIGFLFLFVFFSTGKIKIKKNLPLAIRLFAGLLPGIFGTFLYNYLRFGTLGHHEAYNILFEKVKHEYWFRFGYLSFKYIPIHLKEMLFSTPVLIPKFPYVAPSMFALSTLITTPFLFYLFRLPIASPKKTPLIWIAILALIGAALPSLCHGGNGFTQFAYRHTLDYMPFLMMLCAFGTRGKIGIIEKVVIGISILVNLWGVVTISFLNIVLV